jgi:hypothetical protein
MYYYTIPYLPGIELVGEAGLDILTRVGDAPIHLAGGVPRVPANHRLINYIDTKAKCRSLKN